MTEKRHNQKESVHERLIEKTAVPDPDTANDSHMIRLWHQLYSVVPQFLHVFEPAGFLTLQTRHGNSTPGCCTGEVVVVKPRA